VLAIWDFSTGYQLLGVLHILAVIAAFGPLLVYPSLRRAGDTVGLAKLHMWLSLPALTLVWIFGMGMVGTSKNNFEMSQTWIILSLIGWVVLMAVSWFLIRPAITDTGEAASKRFSAGIGVTHVLMIVILFLMVFKPGAPAGF
jgi:uncharacterized membrane protein